MTLQEQIALDWHAPLMRINGHWTVPYAMKSVKYPHTREHFYLILRILLKKKMVKKVYHGHYLTVDKL